MLKRSTSMTAVFMTAAFILMGCARGEGPAGVPAADAKAAPAAAAAANDPGDWPMYNRDVRGHRHNGAERTLGPANVGQLVEKWRFPADGSGIEIGVIHATPVVVDGCVYFGTASDPAFYKLAPDGTMLWSYRNPAYGAPKPPPDPAKTTPAQQQAFRLERFQTSGQGILGSALVSGDTVYFGDIGGTFYALDRDTGKERWTVNARGKDFPGAHDINMFFASPILADGKIIVGGGTLEQMVAAIPGYSASSGRGFVIAFEPPTGAIAWKYDVGPKPERFDPPMTIEHAWGTQTFQFGPATSSVWSTPSFDEETGTIFFGTDVNTAPRRPTADDPRLETRESCAIIALDVRSGAERWVTQVSPGDVWTNAMCAYDPKTGRYKDQAVGDTPKVYTIDVDGKATKVVGAGCKNGGFYVLRADDGQLVAHTPIYTGPPTYPLDPPLDQRVLALPSPIGGLQSGCATDGATVYTNGIDTVRFGTQMKAEESGSPPTGGRVTAISADTRAERWRHDRAKVASIGGPAPIPVYKNVGDPVASGVAVANGVCYFTAVASGKLVVLDAGSGALLKEIPLGRVWCGPSVSRGRVYVGTGNTLFSPAEYESFFPKKGTGELHSFGLPGEDEVDQMGGRRE